MERSEEEVQSASDLLRLAAKTSKVLRLYESENEVSKRLEDELAAFATDHLETWGPCELNVLKSELKLGDATVYRSDEQTDSIAFPLFRDGIRQLTLLPGIEFAELHDLLTAINRVDRASSTDEDLVTIFWERDFTHIRYVAIEELHETAGGGSIEDQLRSGHAEGGAKAVDADPIDFRQPLNHLPVEACMLTQQEAEELETELAGQEDLGRLNVTIDLAIDLTVLSKTDEPREKIAAGLITILDQRIGEGAVGEVIEAIKTLDMLAATEVAESTPMAGLRDRVVRDFAAPRRLATVLGCAEANAVQPDLLRFLLKRLGEAALPSIVAGLAELKSGDLQAVAAEVIHEAGPKGIRNLLDWLEADTEKDPDVFRVILQVLRRIPGDGKVEVFEYLLQEFDSSMRRLVLRDLGPFRQGEVGKLWMRLLGDEDENVRMQAVSAIVRSGLPATVEHLIHRAVDPGFDALSENEKTHLMSGIGRLAGDESLAWFEQILGAARSGLFASRSDRESVRAAVAGLRAVGSPAASRLLGKLARHGNRQVRTACRSAMEKSEHRK